MQQQMQRDRATNERNSVGENSAESVSPVSSGAPATSRDLLNALAEQKLPTLMKQETPKTPRRSKYQPLDKHIKLIWKLIYYRLLNMFSAYRFLMRFAFWRNRFHAI